MLEAGNLYQQDSLRSSMGLRARETPFRSGCSPLGPERRSALGPSHSSRHHLPTGWPLLSSPLLATREDTFTADPSWHAHVSPPGKAFPRGPASSESGRQSPLPPSGARGQVIHSGGTPLKRVPNLSYPSVWWGSPQGSPWGSPQDPGSADACCMGLGQATTCPCPGLLPWGTWPTHSSSWALWQDSPAQGTPGSHEGQRWPSCGRGALKCHGDLQVSSGCDCWGTLPQALPDHG